LFYEERSGCEDFGNGKIMFYWYKKYDGEKWSEFIWHIVGTNARAR
jgi:hypothetical protein